MSLSRLRQEFDGGGVEVMGTTIQGLQEAIVFGKTHFPPDTWQTIPSLMGMLQMMRASVVHTEDNQQAELHAERVKRTPAQTAIIASYATTYPPVLMGGKEEGTCSLSTFRP